MKKIGIFLGITPQMGGAFQYSQCLLRALDSLSNELYEKRIVYTDPYWEKYLKNYSGKKMYIPSTWLSYKMGILLTLSSFPVPLWHKIAPSIDPAAKMLLRHPADLWIFSAYSFVCYQMPVNSIGVIHDLMHRYERQFKEFRSPLIYFWREKAFEKLCRWTKGIFVDSNLGKKQVIDSYAIDPTKIHILPFSPPEYIFNKSVPSDFDTKLKLPSKYVFYPAQFWEHKNHKRLIMALNEVKEQAPDIKLVLTGSKKNNFKSVMKFIEAKGIKNHIVYLGFLPDEYLPEVYRRARALIMPTFFGPTNIPPLEAFACDCPVAVSRIYGMPEQLQDAALYFNPYSVKDIAEKMLKLWQDDVVCSKLIEKGRQQLIRLGQHNFSMRFREHIEKILADIEL